MPGTALLVDQGPTSDGKIFRVRIDAKRLYEDAACVGGGSITVAIGQTSRFEVSCADGQNPTSNVDEAPYTGSVPVEVTVKGNPRWTLRLQQ